MVGIESQPQVGVERRLEIIEFHLFWEGCVNHFELMDTFGVSLNQASTDLNRYFGFAPDNMICDNRTRTYVRTPEFKPRFLEPDASCYLAGGWSPRSGGLVECQPPAHSSASTPVRGVNSVTPRTVVGVIPWTEITS